MSARDTAGFGLDDMEDLVLDDVHADWEDEDEVVETKAVGGVQGKSGLKKRASGKARRLYKSWAKNVLMWAETLDCTFLAHSCEGEDVLILEVCFSG